MNDNPRKNNARQLTSQRAQARHVLGSAGMMRASELVAQGIAATTISRMLEDGDIIRLSRGLYQLSDAPLDTQHDLAEAAKRVPNGVICLVSALSYHELTDQLPRQVWMAIGAKDWAPADHGPKLRLIRMTDALLIRDTDTAVIGHVPVRVFNVPRTLADCFRFRAKVGLSVAVEALQEALRRRRTTPALIAEHAQSRRVWAVMRPYIEAFTIDG
jgi:predicted transcriptional regulator of viral defense system